MRKPNRVGAQHATCWANRYRELYGRGRADQALGQQLLRGADPILEAFHDRRIAPGEAARRMGRLEQRFAAYAVDIAAVNPPTVQLRALTAGYANTYVSEDAYLSTLVAGLADGELTDLPNTHAAQRAAIIRWRIGLTVLARAADAPLPADLQQAGRGEIAPSPNGS